VNKSKRFTSFSDCDDVFSALTPTAPVSSWTRGGNVAVFQYIDYNCNSSFDGTKFQPAADGYFLFYLTHSTSWNISLNAALVDETGAVITSIKGRQILQRSTGWENTFHLSQVSRGQSVRAVSISSSNSNEQAIWIGFRFDLVTMNPFVAMQKSCLYLSGKNTSCLIPNDRKHTNIKYNWNVLSDITNKFSIIKVPQNGIYIIHISYEMSYIEARFISMYISITLAKINKSLMVSKYVYAIDNFTLINDNFSLSMLYLLNVTSEDNILIEFEESHKPATLTTLFLLYSPAKGQYVAWSMTLRTRSTSDNSTCVVDVSANVDVTCTDTFDADSSFVEHSVGIARNGLYYVSLTATVSSGEVTAWVDVSHDSTLNIAGSVPTLLMVESPPITANSNITIHAAVLWRLYSKMHSLKLIAPFSRGDTFLFVGFLVLPVE
jgi:hypothetical protein